MRRDADFVEKPLQDIELSRLRIETDRASAPSIRSAESEKLNDR